MALPTITVDILGYGKVAALVDSGSTRTIVSGNICKCEKFDSGCITAVNGTDVGYGTGKIKVVIQGRELDVQCFVLRKMLVDFDVIVGMDIIRRLGGVNIDTDCKVAFTAAAAVLDRSDDAALEIDDTDFSAKFEDGRWKVAWKWKVSAPELTNRCHSYGMKEELKQAFDTELQDWVNTGILKAVPPNEVVESYVPLMAVDQTNKGKVRPVLDFRELNDYVSCHPASIEVIDDTLRTWRKVGHSVMLLDLKKAYLQLHVDKELWKYQIVKWGGCNYYLTRLGFGLNCAPKIMSTILRTVLALDAKIRDGTCQYIDDILVNVDVVSAAEVARHLERYGLITKEVQELDGARVLGLAVQAEEGKTKWKRGNELPRVPEKVTKRELFSITGALVGHFPVANWLRVACSYVKRVCDANSWDDEVSNATMKILHEIIDRIKLDDPVRGVWDVPEAREARVWCDASSLAMGCCLEINRYIVEDAAWLRKRDDHMHINLAELDAVIKGVNLALKWNVKQLEIVTDSATVHGWLTSTFCDTHRIHTQGMCEMLVKRRLKVIKALCDEYGVAPKVVWVESKRNVADGLTRVPQKWLSLKNEEVCGVSVVKEVHEKNHLGVDRTLYLARLENPTVTRREVEDVVRACSNCKSIDPPNEMWEKGGLDVRENWVRLAIDTTHYNGNCYLSCVDCGPSRFMVWKLLRDESAVCVTVALHEIFNDRGPPKQLLMDNGRAFRSGAMQQLLGTWGVAPIYRCAYRPAGNGIVERSHRTIKRMAARSGGSPMDMVYWYNSTPKAGVDPNTVPGSMLHNYEWRVLQKVEDPSEDEQLAKCGYTIGDSVFVKPPGARCTTRWQQGTVTGLNSATNVDVDGVPRHVGDLRLIPEIGDDLELEEEHEMADVAGVEEGGRPQRTVRAPNRWGNNIYDV